MKLLLTLVVSLFSITSFAQTKVCAPQSKSKLYLETKTMENDESGIEVAQWSFSDGSKDPQNTLTKKVVIGSGVSIPAQALHSGLRIVIEKRTGAKIKDIKNISMSKVLVDDVNYLSVLFTVTYSNNKVYYILSSLQNEEISAVSENPAIAFSHIIEPYFIGSKENCK